MARGDSGPVVLNSKTAKLLSLTVPGQRAAAAIDHGGTNPRLGFFDETGRPVLRYGRGRILREGVRLHLPSYTHLPEGCGEVARLPKWTAEHLGQLVGPLLETWGVTRLGYAIAGPVTRDGVVAKTPQIWGPSVTRVPYRQQLGEALGLAGRVVLGNDMWAAANDIIMRGKQQKPKLNVRHFIVITVSSGVGSKVVANGEVQLGVGGLAGEIGHMPVLWPSEIIPGRRCGCGGLYCLEAGASGNANAYRAKAEADRLLPLAPASPSRVLIRKVASVPLEPGDREDEFGKTINTAVVRAAHRGDPLALSVVSDTVKPLARAVASLEAQLDIANFYFVGGFALALGKLFLSTLRAHLLATGIIGRSDREIVRIGRLYEVKGQDWGLRGAALAAHRAFAD